MIELDAPGPEPEVLKMSPEPILDQQCYAPRKEYVLRPIRVESPRPILEAPSPEPMVLRISPEPIQDEKCYAPRNE